MTGRRARGRVGEGIACSLGMAKRATGQSEKRAVERTEDGRYVVIDGRKWRATNPALSEQERARWVGELMAARRAVGAAMRARDSKAEREARVRVHAAKVALGERGPAWWGAREKKP